MRADDNAPTGGWERFCARELDALIILAPTGLVLVPFLTLDVFAALRWSGWLLLIYPLIRTALWACGEILLLPTLGVTPGRAFMGLRVEAKDGSLPTRGAVAIRTGLLAVFGMGVWLPILPTVAALAGALQLDNFRTTLWDHLAGTRVAGAPAPLWRQACGLLFWFLKAFAALAIGWIVFMHTALHAAMMSV